MQDNNDIIISFYKDPKTAQHVQESPQDRTQIYTKTGSGSDKESR